MNKTQFTSKGEAFHGSMGTGWLLSVPNFKGCMAYGQHIQSSHYLYSDESIARDDFAAACKAYGKKYFVLLRHYVDGGVTEFLKRG